MMHKKEAFSAAEGAYRKALSMNEVNAKAQHNIGNSSTVPRPMNKPTNAIFKVRKTAKTVVKSIWPFTTWGIVLCSRNSMKRR